MIRAVAIASLLSLLVLVLYLPSANPPERFLAQIRAEQQAMAKLWGDATAARILSRALSLQDTAREATPVPTPESALAVGKVNGAVALEMASVNQRLFNNAYFRSIDALVLLAAFRLSAMLEWLPWLVAFAVAAITDGAILRLIKSKEFRQHDPELFAVFACLAIVTACAAVVGFVVPVALHPLAMPCWPLVVSVLVGRAVGSFHRQG